MKLFLTPVLYEQVIEDCLLSAGSFGKTLLGRVEWGSCDFNLIVIPGISHYPTDRFSNHIIPVGDGAGTFKSPDNVEELVARIRGQGLSLVARDFALDQPHKLMRSDRVLIDEDQSIYYVYDAREDGEAHLRDVVRLATSWTFLGMTFDLLNLPMSGAAMRENVISDLIFRAYAGDTYIVANLPRRD